MKIDENYSVEQDTHCWVLKFEKEGELNERTGKNTIHSEEWYHPTLKSALKKYMDVKLKGSEALCDVIQRLNEVELVINNLK